MTDYFVNKNKIKKDKLDLKHDLFNEIPTVVGRDRHIVLDMLLMYSGTKQIFTKEEFQEIYHDIAETKDDVRSVELKDFAFESLVKKEYIVKID